MHQGRSLVGAGATVLTIVAGIATLAVHAQPKRTDADDLRAAYEAYRFDAAVRPRTPRSGGSPSGRRTSSGRATDIAVADRGGSRRIYAGYATSGAWYTDDNGVTWQPIFENYASTSIGDIAVAPSNPDILWVGTGEANIFRASMPGVGVFKSTDGGRTFAHMRAHRHPDHRPHHRPPGEPGHRLRRRVRS